MITKENRCGECTLCCTLFPVKEINKPENVPCEHLCSIGCGIYNKKPKACTLYDCAWVQEINCMVELRPDNCGIMFSKLDEEIMFGLIDPRNTPTELGKRQIHEFVNQGYSVVMSSFDRPDFGFFISSKHEEIDIKNKFDKYIEKYGHLRN